MSAGDSGAPAEAGRRGPNGAVVILLATAIGGGAAYILQIIAGVALGTASYASFAVFWSALYLLVSALSGVQQEVARATHSLGAAESAGRVPMLRNFTVAAAALVVLVLAGSAWLWTGAVFPSNGWSLVPPLVVGVAAYLVVAAMSGVLYGLSFWTAAAAMTVVDGLLRFGIVGGMLLFTRDSVVLAWGVALPFVLAPVILWWFIRAGVVGRFGIDVGSKELGWNVARTVAAAAATGVMVSGLPLMIQATGDTVSPDAFGSLTYAITLTRAPIVIVVLALQSYLVVVFRTHAAAVLGWVVRLSALVLTASSVLALLAWWLGPWVLSALFDRPDVLAGGTIALLVATAGLVGVLCVTGAATLSRAQHGAFAGGWIVAAIVMVGVLLLPVGLHERTILALTLGPLAGLIVQCAALFQHISPGARAASPTSGA